MGGGENTLRFILSLELRGHEADFAHRAVPAPEHLAADHEAGADFEADVEAEKVFDLFPFKVLEFGESREVDDVVHEHGLPEGPLEGFFQIDALVLLMENSGLDVA